MPETAVATPETGAELLARINPRLRVESTNICLRPDLLDEWEEAQDALERKRAEKAPGGRLGSGYSAELKALAIRVQEIESAIDETQVTFTFNALPKDKWQELSDEHPPRKGNDMDYFVGYDRDAVADQAVQRCLVSPVFEQCATRRCEHEDCGTWQQFTKNVNPGEWGVLRSAVNKVNQAVVAGPKSGLASQVLAKRGTTSPPPDTGE